jgi:citrate synthase
MNANVSTLAVDDRQTRAEGGTLAVDGHQMGLVVKHGSIGPSVVDISKLYSQTGMFTYDPGFTSTAACESAITFIDGDEGVLLYRGYPIEQLAEHGDFLETCYLLLYGELPTAAQKADFDYRVTRHTMVHEQMMRFFQGFRRDAHPMAIMVGCVGALSAFYHDSTDISDPQQRMIASMRMIAKLPTLASMAYKYSVGQPFIYPKNDLDYTSNFLRMCFAVPCEEYKVNPCCRGRSTDLHPARRPRAERLDLHRAARRLVRRQPLRLHRGRRRLPVGAGARRRERGGAQDAGGDRHARPHPGIRRQAQGQERSLPPDGLRPPGLQELRSRAQIMQKTTHEVLNELGHKDDPLSTWRSSWSRCAQGRVLHREEAYPNIDFYSGITLKAMGFPTSMFTVLFAVARTVGWIAQWKEMIEDPSQKIGRPRQLYVGAPQRDYLTVAQRG